MNEEFPKSLRLTRRGEYLSVQQQGRKVHGDHFLFLLIRGEAPRVGVTVSSRVGPAVLRNRIKRWVREFLRRHKKDLPPGDLVIIAKSSAAQADHPTVDRDLSRLFARVRGSSR